RGLLIAQSDLFVVLGLSLLSSVIGDGLDLDFVHEGAVHTHEPGGAGRQKEHITLAQQTLGSVRIDDRSRVDLGGDSEGNSGRNICFDDSGDNVHEWTLSSQHQMYSNGPGLLCESRNRGLHLASGHHHQVSQFVDCDYNVGKRPWGIGLEQRWVICLAELAVVLLDVSNPELGELPVS